MVPLHLVWIFLKLVRGKEVISSSPCLDVLKIRMERRGNDLNRQIYPYLKMDLQHWSMINLLDLIIMTIAYNFFFFFDNFFSDVN